MPPDDPAPTRREVMAAAAAAPLLLLPPPAAAAAAAERPIPVAPWLDYLCRTCGGNAVTRDAWAEWDADTQEWVLGAAFDYAYCHDCDEETQLEEVALGFG